MSDSSASNALLQELRSAQSWSVEYKGVAFDDARLVESVWYYRDIITRKYSRFPLQDQIVLLYLNDASLTVGSRA